MKRRDFLKVAAAGTVAATALNPLSLFAEDQVPPQGQRPPGGAPRGGFPPMEQGPKEYIPTGEGIKVRFLGTGAADWFAPREDGERRRNASVLLDGKVLIDFNGSAVDMLPEGPKPEVIFYTHSHNDHYNAKAAVELGIKRAYLGETWLERAKDDFRKASEETGKPAPEIIPLTIGESVEEKGLKFTPLPANHASNYLTEQTLIYLVEKDSARVLYATDTGGITARAAQMAGMDRHVRGNTFITGIIMEATMGLGYEEDYRIFTHSSVATVATTVKVLTDTGKYLHVPGQKVYITHLARSLHPGQAELDRTLPDPIAAAYDGLEVLFP